MNVRAVIKAAALAPGFTLQPHQQRLTDNATAAASSGNPFRVLGLWSVGAGKGLGSLSAADAIGGSSAVVAPAAMRSTFRDEQKRFLNRSDIPVYSYNNAAAGKVPAVDTLIVDEAQRTGSPSSVQAKAVTDAAARARNVILLSGTPIRNSPSEFAPMMSVLTGKNITADQFNKRYVGTETVRPGLLGWLRGVPSVSRPALVNTDELRHMLDGKIDYYAPEKPSVDVTHETHETEMTPRQAELYSGMMNRTPLWLRWKIRWNYPMTSEELARARSFLIGPRQVALSDLPYRSDNDPYHAFLNSGKLTKAYDLLRKTLDGDKRKKAIVYSNFLEAGLKPYAAALAKEGIPHAIFHGGLSDVGRKELVDGFNKGRIRVALVAPSGSEGISLKGAQLMQVLDKFWHSARTQQAVGRGIRYDSHSDLPEELKRMTVQEFRSVTPPDRWERLAALAGRRFDLSSRRWTVDHYLGALSARKDQLNDQLLALLKQIGTSSAVHV